MKFFFWKIALFLCLFGSQVVYSFEIADDYKSNWAGIEVIAINLKTADKIRNLIPIKIGDNFVASEARKFCALSSKLVKEKTSITDVRCSIVWYGDNKAYLVLDIPGKSLNATFRTIPEKKGVVATLPKPLDKLYKKWEARMSFLISNGSFPIEKFEKDFMDYEDFVLHTLALELNQLALKHNDILLDIVHYSPNAKERQKAATLFSWTMNVRNLGLILKWGLLTDPDPKVRNNIARSFTQFLSTVKDEKLLENLVPAYCKQAAIPTHADRNKALISIKEILQEHPNLITVVDSECKSTIANISKMSILDNIKGPAKDIEKIINTSAHA